MATSRKNEENESDQENLVPFKFDMDAVMRNLGGIEYKKYLEEKRRTHIPSKEEEERKQREREKALEGLMELMRNDPVLQADRRRQEQKERERITASNNKIDDVLMKSALQSGKPSCKPNVVNKNLRKNLFGATSSKSTVSGLKSKTHTTKQQKPKISILANPLLASGNRANKKYSPNGHNVKSSALKNKCTSSTEIQKTPKVCQNELQDALKKQFDSLKHYLDEFRTEEQMRLDEFRIEQKKQFDELQKQLHEIKTDLKNILNNDSSNDGKNNNSSSEFEMMEMQCGVLAVRQKTVGFITPKYKPYKSEGDLRKDTLLKSTGKLQSAIEMYNSCRNVCEILQTPGGVNSSSDGSETPIEKKLSKKVFAQCVLLQDTPRPKPNK